MDAAVREAQVQLEREGEIRISYPADRPEPGLSMRAWFSIGIYVFGVIVGVCIGWMLWGLSWL